MNHTVPTYNKPNAKNLLDDWKLRNRIYSGVCMAFTDAIVQNVKEIAMGYKSGN